MEEYNQQTSVIESPGAYYPQDYSLKTLNFLTASGQKIELKKLLVELSYYEDIYNFVVSGYLTVLGVAGIVGVVTTGSSILAAGDVFGGTVSLDKHTHTYVPGSGTPIETSTGHEIV